MPLLAPISSKSLELWFGHAGSIDLLPFARHSLHLRLHPRPLNSPCPCRQRLRSLENHSIVSNVFTLRNCFEKVGL